MAQLAREEVTHSKQFLQRMCIALGALIFIPALYMTLKSNPAKRVWDETWHLMTAEQLSEQGLTIAFLRGLEIAMGPVYAFVLVCSRSLTHFNLVYCRLISLLCMGGLILIVDKTIKQRREFPWGGSLQLMGFTLFPLMACFAMSDIPMLLLFYIHTALVGALFFSHSGKSSKISLWWPVALGLSLGIAAAGRQFFLVSFIAIPVLLALEGFSLVHVIIFVTLGLLPIGSLMIIWEGPQPPLIQNLTHSHFSIPNMVLGACQFAAMYTVFNPSFLQRQKRIILRVLLVSPLLIFLLGRFVYSDMTERIPLRYLLHPVLTKPFFDLGSYIIWAVMLAVLAGFFFELFRRFLETKDGFGRWSYLVAAALALSPGLSVLTYSARYEMMALPLLFLMDESQGNNLPSWGKLVRIGLGGGLGLVVIGQFLMPN